MVGGWNFSSLKYIDLEEKELEKYLVHKGEILFNRTYSKELVGKTAVYRENEAMAYSGYLIKVKQGEKANSEFAYAYLNSKYGKEYCRYANINAEELKSIKIYLPPMQLQNEFA